MSKVIPMEFKRWRCPRCKLTRITTTLYKSAICDCGGRMVTDQRHIHKNTNPGGENAGAVGGGADEHPPAA